MIKKLVFVLIWCFVTSWAVFFLVGGLVEGDLSRAGVMNKIYFFAMAGFPVLLAVVATISFKPFKKPDDYIDHDGLF